MRIPEPVERYLELGLRLGRHNPDIVDAYYGPAQVARRVADEPVSPPEALVADARRLAGDLQSARWSGSDEDALDPQRRRWMLGQVDGLAVVAGKLAGLDIAYVDEVETCYGVTPRWIDEEEIEAAHRRLDRSLAGTGPLPDRLAAFRDRHTIPSDELRSVIDAVASDFAERTRAMFGLPDGEHVDFELVADKPWSGFNYYEGGLRSRVAINTDLPVLSTSIDHLVAHEAYPGHHTEHCRKEVGLVRGRGHLEESIFLIGAPQCLLAEGLADLGIEVLLGDDRVTVVADLLAPLGITYDVEAIAAVRHFGEVSSRVDGNLGILLNDRGANPDDAIAYAERWALLDHDRATKRVQFLTDRTWRAYISCYVEGLPLCREFVAGDPARFDRLLTEQLLPADLRDAA